IWGSVSRVSPEAPVPIVAKERISHSPGGAGNVAATIAALGGTPVLISAAGQDPRGQDLHSALSERSVSPADVILCPRRRTTVKTRISAHNQQLLRIDDEDQDTIDDILAAEVLAKTEAALPFTGAVVLSDYAKGLLTPELISSIMRKARRRNLPVLVDPKGS